MIPSFIIFACVFIVANATFSEVPDEIDWREQGAVTKVKDQGTCDGGSFYFATLGLIESHYFLSTGEVLDLSEQCALDCSAGYNGGCTGGGVLNTIDFVRTHGIALEENYPYEGSATDCRTDNSQRLFKTIGYEMLPKGEDLLKITVGTIGPVAVTFNGQNLSSYSGGIINDPNCLSTPGSHSGIVVGYGTSDGLDYWIVKMSYGSNWGDDGYFRIARNAKNQCGIADNSIYPLL